MNSIVKYALLAGGGYFLYRWLEGQGAIPSLFGGTAAAPASTPPATTVAPAPPPPTSLAPASVTLTAAESADLPGLQTQAATQKADPNYKNSIFQSAAGGDARYAALVDSLGLTLTADEWNYYAARAGKTANVDLFPAGNRQYKMTAAQYLAARSSAGLSGLGNYYFEADAWPQNHREVTTQSVV